MQAVACSGALAQNVSVVVLAWRLTSTIACIRADVMDALLDAALKASPLFRLAADIIAKERVRIVSLASGDPLFAEGDPGQCAYLILDGVVGLYRRDPALQVSWLFRRAVLGDLIGELAVFSDEARSGSAICLTDAVVAEIDQELLQHCISQSPAFCLALIKSTATAASVGRQAIESELPQIILVQLECGQDSAPSTHYLLELIGDATSSRVVDKRGAEWPRQEQLAEFSAAIQAKRQSIYLVDHCSCIDQTASKLVDRYVLVTDQSTISEPQTLASLDVVRLWPAGQVRPVAPANPESLRTVRQVYNVRKGNDRDARRAVRNILGIGNALVLGGGGAKGFAHVGVLKAFSERGFDDIDIVYGVSIGSFVGGLLAIEETWQDIYAAMVSIFAEGSPYSLSLPVHSVFSYGKDLLRIRDLFGDLDITNTWIPFVPGSVDITNSVMRFWRSGPLFDCVLASMSIPGLAPPVRMADGSYNVDGCVLNNLPVAQARKSNRGRLVAVSLEKGFGPPAPLSSTSNKVFKFLASTNFANDNLPLVSDVITHSLLCTTRIRFKEEARYSDVFIAPDTSRYGILDWKAHREIMDEGYAQGMSAEL